MGERAGVATLHLHPRNKGHHSIGTPPSYDGLDRIEVAVVRLDMALAAAGVAAGTVGLIWIDVEGFEPEASARAGCHARTARTAGARIHAGPLWRRGHVAISWRCWGGTTRSLHNLSEPHAEAKPVQALADIRGGADVLIF